MWHDKGGMDNWEKKDRINQKKKRGDCGNSLIQKPSS